MSFELKSGDKIPWLNFKFNGTIEELQNNHDIIVNICLDHKYAILYRQHENENIRYFANKKLIDFPTDNIELIELKKSEVIDDNSKSQPYRYSFLNENEYNQKNGGLNEKIF
jgi:hypothetical protein